MAGGSWGDISAKLLGKFKEFGGKLMGAARGLKREVRGGASDGECTEVTRMGARACS